MQIEGCKPGGIGARALAGVSGAATASRRGVTTHNSVLKSNSGWALDPVAWARRAAATAKLMEQNDRIAEALQRAGEDVIHDGGVTMISAVTNVVEKHRTFRAVRFLPVVAARDRRPLVNGMKVFIREHPNRKYFRYAVMTCSEPVPAFGGLRGSIQTLSRRVTTWAHEVRKKYGMKVLFRGTEFTRKTAAERGMTDRYDAATPLYHVHANILYWPTRALTPAEWTAFLNYTRTFMGAEWKDNGKVERVEEIVKYCSKPNDTLAATDDELVWLYRETQRLKICQPLGVFKEWLAELKKRRQKIVNVNLGRGDGELMRVKKGRRGQPVNEDDEGGDDEAGEAADEDSGEAAEKPERQEKQSDCGPAANIIVCLTLPQWRHTPWAEPVILVQNYDPLKLSDEAGADIRE